jgi:GT2 family glycosyltransferase
MAEPLPQEESSQPRVSVILVSHNQAPALRRAIEALEKSQGREKMEILLVDCGSQDESPHLDTDYPGITVLRLPHHFGATKAMNIASRTAKGEYFFFLSPDVEVAPETVKQLADRLDADNEATAVTPLLVDPEGKPASRVGKVPNRDDLRAACRGEDPPPSSIDTSAESIAVEYAGRDALLVRSVFIRGMNYFDARYGHYWADADLAVQIKRAQKRIKLYPSIRATWHRTTDPFLADTGFSADCANGAAAYLSRYEGFMAGLTFKLGAIFSALLGFRLGEVGALISGSKVDGT